jgi:hypothetical protein
MRVVAQRLAQRTQAVSAQATAVDVQLLQRGCIRLQQRRQLSARRSVLIRCSQPAAAESSASQASSFASTSEPASSFAAASQRRS